MSVVSPTSRQAVQAINAPAPPAITSPFALNAAPDGLHTHRLPQGAPAFSTQMQAALLQLQAGGTQAPMASSGAESAHRAGHEHSLRNNRPAQTPLDIEQKILTNTARPSAGI